MLTNGAQSIPILTSLKSDLRDENKWIELVHCQTNLESKLNILWRAAATLPTNLSIWTMLVEHVNSTQNTQNIMKTLDVAIQRFPDNFAFWDLALHISPKLETFLSAMQKVDPAKVWPKFLHFLVNNNVENDTKLHYLSIALTEKRCSLDELANVVDKNMLAQLLISLKPDNFMLWNSILNEDLPLELMQKLISTSLDIFGGEHQAELVLKITEKLNFKEARTMLIHYLDNCNSVQSYCSIFEATTKLYESEIDKNASDVSIPQRWNVNQILLTELKNILLRRPQQLSDLAILEDQNNVDLWLDRAKLMHKKPHVAAHILEQAIQSINPYMAHNGDLTEVYINYANLLLLNGSSQEVACAPIEECLKMNSLNPAQRANLYTCMVNLQNVGSPKQALKTLEQALKDDSLESIRSQLWLNYFKLLKTSDEILAAFSRCCIQKDVTPRIVIDVGVMLKDNTLNSMAVFDRGVSLFPQNLSIHIWKSFIENMNGESKEALSRVRIVFERAILLFANDLNASEQLICTYGTIEQLNPLGSMYNLRRAVQRVIAQTKNKQVFDLYISTFADINGKRTAYERAIKQLNDVDASAMALEMAQFEEKLQELNRCQELYKYAVSLHRSSEALAAWQQFELRNEIGMVEFVPQH